MRVFYLLHFLNNDKMASIHLREDLRTPEQKEDAAIRAIKVLENLHLLDKPKIEDLLELISVRLNVVKRTYESTLKSSSPIGSYYSMKRRCYDKSSDKYKIYGGRGIIICEEWLNDRNKFIEWCLANGWKKGLQVDRIYVDGNYGPGNCRLATTKQNTRNKRDTIYATYDGEEKPFSEWCEILGVSYSSLSAYMKRNNLTHSEALKMENFKKYKKKPMVK